MPNSNKSKGDCLLCPPSSRETLTNLCLVGTGGIATQHIKAFLEIGGVHPRWVVSRRPEAVEEFAGQWQFDHCGIELDKALLDPSVDLVVITSPSSFHASQAMSALRANKDVIVEIPVAVSLADALRVAELAAETGRRVQVCHTMRSFAGIREVRRRVQSGEFSLSQITAFFSIPRRRNQSWAGQRNWIDNLLWHHGCHLVDVAMWVLGVTEVERIGAIIGRPHPQFGMAMDVSIQFRTAKQQVVTQALTYNAEEIRWELRFIGDEDVLIFDTGRLLNEQHEDLIPESSYLDLVPQNSKMLATLKNRIPGDYEIESVLPSMRVLHDAEQAATSSA